MVGVFFFVCLEGESTEGTMWVEGLRCCVCLCKAEKLEEGRYGSVRGLPKNRRQSRFVCALSSSFVLHLRIHAHTARRARPPPPPQALRIRNTQHPTKKATQERVSIGCLPTTSLPPPPPPRPFPPSPLGVAVFKRCFRFNSIRKKKGGCFKVDLLFVFVSGFEGLCCCFFYIFLPAQAHGATGAACCWVEARTAAITCVYVCAAHAKEEESRRSHNVPPAWQGRGWPQPPPQPPPQ